MRWTVLLLALAACNSGKSKETCRAEAAAMKALFAGANLEGEAFPIDAKLHLVQRSDLSAQPALAPVLYARANEVRFRDQVTANARDLAPALGDAYQHITEDIERFYKNGRPHRPDAHSINLVFDEATPWRTVVDVVATARDAGFTHPSLVFGLPTKLSTTPRAPIDDELDQLVNGDPSRKMTGFAEMITREIKSCPAATKVFGAVGSEEGGNKAELIASAMPDALVECNCNVNVPNLSAVLWRIMVNPNPIRVLAFDADAPAETVKLPATATWRDAAKRFTPALKNADLVVE